MANGSGQGHGQGDGQAAGRPSTSQAVSSSEGILSMPPARESLGSATPLTPPAVSTGAVRTGVAAKPLESLAPRFKDEDHGTYLRRLEEAVKDPKNLNIALTGRYGAGKSSVLDEFEASHRRKTQRLAISTLAPGEEGETTTNRIQKEVVKQLLYGASQKVGKNSRFSKIAVLSKPRAFAESAVFVLGIGALLHLFGWLPDIKWTGADEATNIRWAGWAGAAALATMVVGSLRLVTYGRFLSDVSAAGAGLSLSEKPESFFDKYLDEIVHYFDRESKDIVIFEDLDRFEDPHIFEALRELNILLNETPRRRRKRSGNRPGRALRRLLDFCSEGLSGKVATKLPHRWANRLLGLGVPLRFVYAVRDSVFDKIDGTTANTATGAAAARESADQTTGPDAGVETPAAAPARPVDAAAAETLRANRTKFFDIVIPLVPFISHRNARDLLIKLLAERGIVGVKPQVINTIARHCTDMRLMRNMCNEYLVFAERLLEPKEPNKPAPGMDASLLFALVAYKNFHLEDFENITRRDSDLDRLYEFHRRMVRETIAAKDVRKRALEAQPERDRTRTATASLLGARLILHAQALRDIRGWSQHPVSFRVGQTMFEPGDVSGYDFWAEVAQTRKVEIFAAGNRNGQLDANGLSVLAPESLDAAHWADHDQRAYESELADIEVDIEQLRRADFADLIDMPRFTVVPDAESPPAATGIVPGYAEPQTFADLLETTLQSDLARDLVRRGYIDRNFSLYAAQFYGQFTGVDVANYMVQHVQTNTPAVDYDLSRPGAVANLLTEAVDAGEELLGTVAAYNIDIVNHLLSSDEPGARVVVQRLIASGADDHARAFMTAYFTSKKSERNRLAALLAELHWREVFVYLTSDDGVPTTARPALVSAAIVAFDPRATYDFSDDVRTFIATHYAAMPAFGPLPADAAVDPAVAGARSTVGGETDPVRVAAVLDRAQVVISDLTKVRDPRVRRLIVEASRYTLTVANLRAALDIDGTLSLDRVKENETVYTYCLQNLPAYLAAVGPDSATNHAVGSPQVLVKVLRDLAVEWDEDQTSDPYTGDIAELLAQTSPVATLGDLTAAPRSTWTALAAAGLFRASLANVEQYRSHTGGVVDAHLASLLKRAGTVHVTEAADATDPEGAEYDRSKAAVAILNTEAGLTNDERVQLAASLDAPFPLPADEITWASGNLFAQLLEHRLVDDDAQTFARIRLGGWSALAPAIATSDNIADFIDPALVEGMVADLLADRPATAKVGRVVLEHVDEYVPEDDWPALRAVAAYADAHSVQLTPDTVARMARVQRGSGVIDARLMLRLLLVASPDPTADHIVEVFTHLSSPYSQIAQSGAKFKVDRDDTHDQLLKVLAAANRITRGTTRATPLSRSQYTVTVP